jgi:hypothetical protein
MKKGSHLTEENKLKISLAHKGKKLSEETKEKIRNGNLGVKRSAETKRKMSLGKTGLKRKPFTKEQLKNMSDAQKGSTNHRWLGGQTNEPYSINCNNKLRESIRKHDNFKCRECGKENSRIVHHIDYNKLNSSPKNLITLCLVCHGKTGINRKYWTEHFNNLMKLI